MLDELDPEVEWHSVIMGSLSGEATVFRGRGRVRECSATCTRPSASSKSSVVDFRNGKAIRVRTYFDSQQALEAAGLRE